MSYATPTDFDAHGLPAVALDGFAGDVQDHLDSASGEIDTYLRGRYSVPLVSPAPAEIVKAECVLAAYSVLALRGFDPEEGSNKNVRMRYEDTKKWLSSLANGKVNLSILADATPNVHDGRPRVRSRSRDTSWRFR